VTEEDIKMAQEAAKKISLDAVEKKMEEVSFTTYTYNGDSE
jgi:hypothetical protein